MSISLMSSQIICGSSAIKITATNKNPAKELPEPSRKASSSVPISFSSPSSGILSTTVTGLSLFAKSSCKIGVSTISTCTLYIFPYLSSMLIPLIAIHPVSHMMARTSCLEKPRFRKHGKPWRHWQTMDWPIRLA